MLSLVMRVAALVIALSLAAAEDALGCSATAPNDDLAIFVWLGVVGTGVVVSGIALALGPKKPQSAAADDGSTTTLAAS